MNTSKQQVIEVLKKDFPSYKLTSESGERWTFGVKEYGKIRQATDKEAELLSLIQDLIKD